MLKEIQIDVGDKPVDARYGVHYSSIEWLLLKINGDWVPMDELLLLPHVHQQLSDHWSNIQEEDNA